PQRAGAPPVRGGDRRPRIRVDEIRRGRSCRSCRDAHESCLPRHPEVARENLYTRIVCATEHIRGLSRLKTLFEMPPGLLISCSKEQEGACGWRLGPARLPYELVRESQPRIRVTDGQ